MKDFVTAAMDIQGDTIRYAEIVRPDDALPQLARLKHHTFGFDVSDRLLQPDAPSCHDDVADVFRDTIGPSEVDAFFLVVHPNDAFTFFTPLSVDWSVERRQRELRNRAALLTQIRTIEDVHLHADTVRTTDAPNGSDRLMWVHVVAVPTPTEQRVRTLAKALGRPRPQWTVSTEATIPAVAQIELSSVSHEDALRPYSLAVGVYPNHTEYALASNRNWHFGHVAVDADTMDDRVYFAVSMLNRLDIPVSSVGRLFAYGSLADQSLDRFETIFDRPATPIDLEQILDLSSYSAAAPGSLHAAYAPCVGAALQSVR